MKYPKILEGAYNFYKLNEASKRCLLEQVENGEDYSTSCRYILNIKGLKNSPCFGISCCDCIFGCPRTKEKLEKAKKYWEEQNNIFSYELESVVYEESIINEINLLL